MNEWSIDRSFLRMKVPPWERIVLGTNSLENECSINQVWVFSELRTGKTRTVRELSRLLLLSCAKSHMLSASRQQPRLLYVSVVDRRQTWSMDKS